MPHPSDMLQTVTTLLDWFGIVVFAVSGALVASRKQMDVFGFALLGTVTAIGGGTLRDLLMDLPVFWVRQPSYLVTSVAVSAVTFFLAHIPQSRHRVLLWFDAIGMALFAVTGTARVLDTGAPLVIAAALGVATATFGGIIRDTLGGETPVILTHEIYVTAALAGAVAFIGLLALTGSRDAALLGGFAAAFLLRAAGLYWGLSLPRYRSRPPRDGRP